MIPSESEDQLIADLIDLPVAEREGYLFRTCGDDIVMRQRLTRKLEQLMDSLSASGSAGTMPAHSSRSQIAEALAAGLEVLEKPGTTIGRYTLLQKIGEGGCGIVYLAEQQQPVRREVALKLIKLGLDTREFVARFEAERQALALMEHPNIARVFDAGATEVGRPYFVMELVRGVPITRFCDERWLTPAERLRLFISVCQAVQHAHQKGVIHRDLKPSNILVTLHDGVPVPKIIDFGIAKAMEVRLTEKTLFTQFHAFIGTPAYTSPEQLEMSGLDVDTRSDIYSLGVLLYELLTGRTPFDSQELLRAGLDAMRKTIRETESLRPSVRLKATDGGELKRIAACRSLEAPKLVHLIHGDLDWIVMKCLEKDRARRYETANGLAADLQRYLNDEPIVARPPSSAYRFQKLVRRNKLAVVAGMAVAAALLLGTIASTWQAVRATHAKQEALAAQAGEAAARARAEAQELIARQRAYASDMNIAIQALHGDNLGEALDLLDRQRPQPGQSDLRGWEWRYLWQQTRSDALSVLCQKKIIQSLAVSADGRWVAIGIWQADGIFVWDLETRQEVAHLAQGLDSVRAVFSPVEPLLAFATDDLTAGGKSLHLWNAETRQLVAEFPLEGACPGLAFSQDGRTIVTSTVGSPGHLTVWRVSDGVQLASLPSEQGSGNPNYRFAATGDLSIAAFWARGRIHVVDLHNHKELWDGITIDDFTTLAFSPDGTILATADTEIHLWDVATGKAVGRLEGHKGLVRALVFWPDGRKLASGSEDRTIRTWDLTSRTCTDLLRGHRMEVRRLALMPDNQTLVSGGKDGLVCFWDTSVTHLRKEHVTWPGRISSWVFAPDSKSLLTLDSNFEREVVRWSGSDFRQKEVLLKAEKARSTREDCFSSDGRFVACRGSGGSIAVWDIPRRTLAYTFSPAGKDEYVFPRRFLADGKRLLVMVQSDNRMIEWDLATGREVQSWSVPLPPLPGCGLSRDEKRLALAGGKLAIRNLVEKSTFEPNVVYPDSAGRVTFSPSGKLLAMGILLGYFRVWETETWREVATLPSYSNMAVGVDFSPDGRQLATTDASEDKALKLWAVDGWQNVATLPAQGHSFIDVAFSPDGNSVGVGTGEGFLHVWRAPSWEEIEKAEARDKKATGL